METINTPVPPAVSAEFDFAFRNIRVNGHNICYVECGEGDPVLFIHGNPTSSYVYRNVIRPVAEMAGRRCIAMDLLGFGRSDKPQLKHTCSLHAEIITCFIQNLKLKNVVLVAEDWGGFLGTYVMTQNPTWFESAVLMETFLWPFMYKDDYDPAFVLPFRLMRSPIGGLFSKRMNLMIDKLIPEHCPISEESLQYYRDSVPDYKSRKAIGDFPRMLPTNGKPKESNDFALNLQQGLHNIAFPVLWIKAEPGVVISKNNPIGLERLEDLSRRMPSLTIRDFGHGYHFLTEENPVKVATMVAEWLCELKGSH